MPVSRIKAASFGQLDNICVRIESELRASESVLYATRCPADWLPILQQRLPQYDMQPHGDGVLIKRKTTC